MPSSSSGPRHDESSRAHDVRDDATDPTVTATATPADARSVGVDVDVDVDATRHTHHVAAFEPADMAARATAGRRFPQDMPRKSVHFREATSRRRSASMTTRSSPSSVLMSTKIGPPVETTSMMVTGSPSPSASSARSRGGSPGMKV